MSETVKHTPGEWRVEQDTTLVWGNCNPDDHSTRGMGYLIAEARISPSGNWSTGPYADEGEANARLIAAAPEMLEALKHAEAILTYAPDFSTNKGGTGPNTNTRIAREKVQAAIAKAEGQQ